MRLRLRQRCGRAEALAAVIAVMGLGPAAMVSAQEEPEKILRAVQVPPGDPSSIYTYPYNYDLFSLQIGTPPRNVSVQISTSSSELWLPHVAACVAISEGPCDTPNSFDPAKSSSYRYLGEYFLGARPEIGVNNGQGSVGSYGLDRISFGTGTGTVELGSEFVSDILVATMNESQWLENPVTSAAHIGVGILGLNVFEWDGDGTRKPGVFPSLKNAGVIGSLYYGYGAGCDVCGAQGRRGSLSLGGYNKARLPDVESIHWNDAVFSLNPESIPAVLINKIRVVKAEDPEDPGWDILDPRPLSLLQSPILAKIDASTPYIWLPKDVCENFKKAFVLDHKEGPDRYLLPTNISFQNLALSFNIADLKTDDTKLTGPRNSTTLNLPFPLLNVTDPSYNKADPDAPRLQYMPIKCSEDDDTWTLGRAFLQAFYMRIDYSRAVFYLHPDTYSSSIQLVPVEEGKPGDTDLHLPSSKKLSRAALIGISIGGGVLGILLIIALVICIRRRQKKKAIDKMAFNDNKPPLPNDNSDRPYGPGFIPHLPPPHFSTKPGAVSPPEIPNHPIEIHSNERSIAELGTETSHSEMEGSPVVPGPQPVGEEKRGILDGLLGSREDGPRVKFLGARWWRGEGGEGQGNNGGGDGNGSPRSPRSPRGPVTPRMP